MRVMLVVEKKVTGMFAEIERRRAVLAVSPGEESALRALFAREPLADWDTTVSDSFEKARFVLQHGPCDVLLVDESLVADQGEAGLTWLARQREVPTVFLAGVASSLWTHAFEHGVSACVPRQLSFEYPPLLAAALQRASHGTQLLRGRRQADDALKQCRRQVDRLVELLWRTTPLDPGGTWFTQRSILERLQEEVARSGRHGTPLTVALGEVQAEDDAATARQAEATARCITGAKRRCDVAGQYGLRGFLLLMVHTPEEGAVVCCRRLQHALESVHPPRGPHGPVRACFGIASISGKDDTLQGLLSGAEQRLEAAKKGADERIVMN